MVTGATLHKDHFFKTPQKLTLLEGELLSLAKKYNWQLEAWAVFVNHYHLVARSDSDAASLRVYLQHLHSNTSRKLNHWISQRGGRSGTTFGRLN